MESKFADEATQYIFDGVDSKKARKAIPADLTVKARRKLQIVDAALSLDDLRLPPGNMLEALVGDRAGQHSIRINGKYRVCFVISEMGATRIEIVDYH